jgi:ArsR family transcriptional regulator
MRPDKPTGRARVIWIKASAGRPCANAQKRRFSPVILAALAALAEPTRLEAMRLLADGSEHCVCDLMRTLGATQSRMSRHMQVLKQAGLVLDRRDAQWVRYRINPDLPLALARLVDAALERPIMVTERAA